MVQGNRHIQRRQQHCHQKGGVLDPANQRGIGRTIAVVVHSLEAFAEQLGNHQCERRAVDQQPDASLQQLGTEHVRSLGSAHSVEQTAAAVLQKGLEIAGGEYGLQFHFVQPCLDLCDQGFGNTICHVAKAKVCLAFGAFDKQFQFQLRGFHAAAKQGHIHADDLNEAVLCSHDVVLAGGLADGTLVVALYPEYQCRIGSVQHQHGKAGVQKPEQVSVGACLCTVDRIQLVIPDKGENICRSGAFQSDRGNGLEDQFRHGGRGQHALTAEQGGRQPAENKFVDQQV